MIRNYKVNWAREIALTCFFVSGASGLMYEVAWNRMLGLVFGNTVFATSTVLTAFMAGLTLGSYLSGRYADRIGRTLRAYAVLEIGIGVYCFLIPFLIELTQGIYLPLQRSFQLSFYFFSLIRFILSFFLLLIPAALMGATTPIFSRFYVERGERFGYGVGQIYAVNTFGAFVGVMLSGFLMIEYLGVRNTINVAVAGNIAVAIVCLILDRNISPDEVPKEAADKKLPGRIPDLSNAQKRIFTALLIGFSISGFAAMVYEVAWTRTLAMIIGSSVYAFSLMLASFLIGIALGSFLFSIIAKRKPVNLLWFTIAELMIGFAALLMLPVFGKMPSIFVSVFEIYGQNYIAMEISKFLMCLLVMIVPTILLGSLFPMVTQICTRDYTELGHRVGTIYSVNTLGNIGGSFMAGFVLIPQIGIQNSIILGASFNILVGCILLLMDQKLQLKRRIIITFTGAALGAFTIILIPSWDKMVIGSGVSVYAPRYAEVQRDEERSKAMAGFDEELLYYKEGLEATVAVRKRPNTGTVVITVNGKVDASNSGDMYTQLMVSHIPLILSQDPKKALVIGLASGVSLGAAARHPLEQIDCAEIEHAMVEASKFFRKENRNVLEDPRVNLVLTDGRNYLAVNKDKRYDVIVSEPSNLWLAGTVNLFSREFYQLCRDRLTDDGIICQWAHIYHMSPEDLKIIVNTFKTVFPHSTIWYTVLGDIFMIGTKEKLVIDYLHLAERYNIPAIREDMHLLDIREPLALLSCYLLDEKGMERFAAGAPINTDDRPILGFSAPRSLYQDTSISNHNMLWSFRTDDFPDMKNFDRERITNRASFWYHLGVAYEFKDMPYKARAQYEKAISVDPSFAPAYVGLALNQHKKRQTDKAIENLKKAIELDPLGAETYYNLAQIYESMEKWNEAVTNYKIAIKLSPRPEKYREKLADLQRQIRSYKQVQ
jgi:spermidine synthase